MQECADIKERRSIPEERKRKIGPRTVPCGTSNVTGIFDDVIFSKSTV